MPELGKQSKPKTREDFAICPIIIWMAFISEFSYWYAVLNVLVSTFLRGKKPRRLQEMCFSFLRSRCEPLGKGERSNGK